MTKRINVRTIAILIALVALLAMTLNCCGSPQYYPVPVPA